MVVSGSGSVMKISSSCHLEAVPEGLIGTRDLILVEYFSFSFFDFRSAHTRDVSLIKLAREYCQDGRFMEVTCCPSH